MGLGKSKEERQQEEIEKLLDEGLGGGPKPEWANADALRSTRDLAGGSTPIAPQSTSPQFYHTTTDRTPVPRQPQQLR